MTTQGWIQDLEKGGGGGGLNAHIIIKRAKIFTQVYNHNWASS